MPRINIYEHSETYSFQTKNNSYATVAFPIAAIWGPTFVEGDEDANPDWVHFSAGYRGTTDFMATFRGANNYLGAREKSFDYALKLLASGYDILVKRVDGLGDQAHSALYVVPAGVNPPESAKVRLDLQPQNGTAANADYSTIPYQFLKPSVSGEGSAAKIVWEVPDKDDTTATTYAVTHKVKDAETGKWVNVTTEGMFRIEAKTASTEALIVAFGKPTIITTEITSVPGTIITIGNVSDKQKQLQVTGTVPVSVYTTNGTLLEKRNITLTETSAYGVESGTIVVNSILAPEFTYIELLELPSLLHLKADNDDTITNLFTRNADDAKYGLFVFRLGEAWNTEAAASATVSGTGITGATVNAATFATQATHAGVYTFIYDGSGWKLGDTTVTLDSWGVTITGTAAGDDSITVNFYEADSNLVTSGSGTATAISAGTQIMAIKAKFPGSFGNNLKVRIKCGYNGEGRKIGTVEVFDNNGYITNPNEIVPTDQLLELVSVAFDADAATDSRPLITEATFSNLATPTFNDATTADDVSPAEYPIGVQVISLLRGTDYATTHPDGSEITADDVKEIVAERFNTASTFYAYISDIATAYETNDHDALVRLYNQQMLYRKFAGCVGELTDPITYDWDALVQGIADDQYVTKAYLEANPDFTMEYEVSTLVTKMIEVAANSKCGAALIGTPFGMPRGIQTGTGASTVKTGALRYKDQISQAVGPTYSTFGEVVGPWCKTTLAFSGANSWIAPEVAHLLLIIAAKGVGGINRWWMIPAGMLGTGVVHSPEYKIKKKYLDLIQDHDEGVCLNPLMEVPGKGFTCFGNSTLWDKPLGTYNALQNLSTRFLTNRVKQRIWDTALQILFRYNNEDAYSHFYAGLSPLLDEMRAAGALTGNEYNPWGYRITMNPDIVNLDRINANTVIGKVELAVTGVIDTVDVDLFLLPPTGFQETYD